MSRSGKVSRTFECFVYRVDFSVCTHCADQGKGRENSNLKLSEFDTDHVTRKIGPLHFKGNFYIFWNGGMQVSST